MATSIIATSANVAKCMGITTQFNNVMGAQGADTHVKSLEGAIEIIWKYWNSVVKSDGTIKRHGYCELAEALGLGKLKFMEFKSLVCKLADKKEGLSSSLILTIRKEGKKGTSVTEKVALWRPCTLFDKSKPAIVDANGKSTYPYVLDKDGKPMKASALKAIGTWTPATVFDLIMQNKSLTEGTFVPYTESQFYTEHPEYAPVDAPAPAPVETPAPVAEAPTAPTPAKGGKRGKKNAA